MIEDSIVEGDLVVMRSISDINEVSNGDVVAARVPDRGTTLKHFYQEGELVTLKPANAEYQPIKVDAKDVEVQGVLIGIWRNVSSK